MKKSTKIEILFHDKDNDSTKGENEFKINIESLKLKV